MSDRSSSDPLATSAPRRAHSRPRASSRTISVTRSPCFSNSLATDDPTRPVTPATTYFAMRPPAHRQDSRVAARRTSKDSHSHCAIMHILDWDGLQVFLAVARGGRVSAAARRLGVEHTTVARRIAALEKTLGVTLFYPEQRSHPLPPQGPHIR